MAKKANLKINLKDIAERFDVNDPKGKLGLALVERAVFMQNTLKGLEGKIDQEGAVTKMCQGSYIIERVNPSLQAYINLGKNYTSTIKQINDLLPKADNTPDEFEEFE